MRLISSTSVGAAATYCSSSSHLCFVLPFNFDDFTSLPDRPNESHYVRISCDTGGSRSLILACALQFADLQQRRPLVLRWVVLADHCTAFA